MQKREPQQLTQFEQGINQQAAQMSEIAQQNESAYQEQNLMDAQQDQLLQFQAIPKRSRKLRKLNHQSQNPQLNSNESQDFSDAEDDDSVSNDDSLDLENQKLPSFKIPNTATGLKQLLNQVKNRIRLHKQIYREQIQQNEGKISYVGENAIPICADVTQFQFTKLITKQKELTGREFDVIMMDPPWKLSTAQPSRGVAIQYDSLADQAISKIPVPGLQENGFLLVWVINNKFSFTVDLMENKWGYRIIDQIPWIKATVNGRIAKGHGFYLQHAKQMCLVGVKGQPIFNKNAISNVIWSERRGQSQKPTQIYEYVQKLVPNGYYLQIFGRRNNLRDRWVTIGNQL